MLEFSRWNFIKRVVSCANQFSDRRYGCQIPKRCDNSNRQSRGFGTSRDLTIRHFIGYQNGALVSQAGISNCFPWYHLGCNYLSLPEIPASGTKVCICLYCCLHASKFTTRYESPSPVMIRSCVIMILGVNMIVLLWNWQCDCSAPHKFKGDRFIQYLADWRSVPRRFETFYGLANKDIGAYLNANGGIFLPIWAGSHLQGKVPHYSQYLVKPFTQIRVHSDTIRYHWSCGSSQQKSPTNKILL